MEFSLDNKLEEIESNIKKNYHVIEDLKNYYSGNKKITELATNILTKVGKVSVLATNQSVSKTEVRNKFIKDKNKVQVANNTNDTKTTTIDDIFSGNSNTNNENIPTNNSLLTTDIFENFGSPNNDNKS